MLVTSALSCGLNALDTRLPKGMGGYQLAGLSVGIEGRIEFVLGTVSILRFGQGSARHEVERGYVLCWI